MSLLNFKKSNTDKPTIIHPTKELATVKNQVEKWILENGKNIANTLSNENIDINSIPSVVNINALYQATTDDVGSVFSKNLSIYKSNFDELDEFENKGTIETNDLEEIDRLEKECKNVIEELNDGHDDDIQDKKDRQDILKTDIKNGRIELSSLKKHNLKASKISAYIIILIIMGGEIYANQDSFSFAGFSEPAPFFMGLAIAMVSAMCGIGKANIIRSQKFSKQIKIFSSIGIFLIVAIVYFVVGSIRSSLMQLEVAEGGIFELTGFHFMMFNLAFFIGVLLCKLFIYPSLSKIQVNEKHAVVKAKLDKDVKEYNRLQSEITNSFKSRETKQTAVKNQYKKLIQPFKANIKSNNKALKNAVLGFNKELALAKSFYSQANAGYRGCVAQLFSSINIYSSEGSEQVVISNLTPLNNPFENIELLAIPKEETLVNSNVNESMKSEVTAWEVMAQTHNGNDTNYSFSINSENN